jgi:perosamine synthetase
LIPIFQPFYDEREEQAVARVLRSKWVGLGPVTEEFERAFASRVGTRYAVAVNSGTAALHIALRLLDISAGDEVLVPTITFVSTAMVMDYEQGTAIFCDVRSDDLTIDYQDAVGRRTSRTRAIIPVLYAGKPVPEPPSDLPTIYDCAHAVGARWNAAAKICCWSFHAVKNLAVGDGGMITFDDPAFYERAVRLRWLGIDKSTWSRMNVERRYWWEYQVDEVGFKYHMNDLAASIGLVQLAKLDEMQRARFLLVKQYRQELADLGEVELATEDDSSSWHLFTIRTKFRDELAVYLEERGISTGVHYKPLHLYPLYHKYALPIAEREWLRLLTLPLFPALTSAQVSFVCDTLKAGLTKARSIKSL